MIPTVSVISNPTRPSHERENSGVVSPYVFFRTFCYIVTHRADIFVAQPWLDPPPHITLRVPSNSDGSTMRANNDLKGEEEPGIWGLATTGMWKLSRISRSPH